MSDDSPDPGRGPLAFLRRTETVAIVLILLLAILGLALAMFR